MNMKDTANRKKLLFLTLGTGKLDEKNNEAGYKETEYRIKNGDEEKVRTTYFVAEPIIEMYNPDEIFILGTVKSVWYQLYASLIIKELHDKSYLNDEGYKILLGIARDQTLGNASDTDKINEVRTKIQSVFDGLNGERGCPKFNGRRLKITVLITKYGINEEQLKENYAIIKGIEKKLDINVSYEVAFDITHSFRSLPLYNLIIFNYIKNITPYELEITHVYYGNVEVRRELNYAPVVDLKDMVNVLNMTSGVAEFKNTGNAVSLLKMLPEDDKLKPLLDDFNTSAQLNAFEVVKKSLVSLFKNCLEDNGKNESENRYTGVREMIALVLKNKFFGDADITKCDVGNPSSMDIKFLLTEWYFNQSRIGLGIATGLEALRDLNTPAFMEARGFTGKEERVYRESAEACFMDIADRLADKKDRSALEDAVYHLGSNLREYKSIRNTVAHSLEEVTDIEDTCKKLETFRNDLRRLKELYDEDDRNHAGQYKKLFCKEKTSTSNNRANGKRCRVLLYFNKNYRLEDVKDVIENEKKFKKADSGLTYDVYCLEPKVQKELFVKDMWKKGKQKFEVEHAYYLYEYLLEHLPMGYTDIQIIFMQVQPSDVEMGFRSILEQLVINWNEGEGELSLYNEDMKKYPALKIPVDMDNLKKQCENKQKKNEQIRCNIFGEKLIKL